MRQVNSRLLGAFVLGAIVLAVAAVAFLGGDDLFAKRRRFVAYFQQSIKGLRVGAPVQFRGIPIGEVTAIEGVYDPASQSVTPRILLEVKPETLVNVHLPDDERKYPVLPNLVPHGLRLSLRTQSLLTGQLYVAMDFHPGEAPRWLDSAEDPYPELPTIDSGLDETLAKLQALPIEEMLVQATRTLEAAEEVLRDPQLGHVIASLGVFLRDADALVVEARGSLENLEGRLSRDTLTSIEGAMRQAESALGLLQDRLSEDGALNQELLTALRDISSAARGVRALAWELEEHPESLVRGR